MSHPVPGHDYGEEQEGNNPRLNALQRAMGKLLKQAGNNMKKPNENHLEYLKRVTKHQALEKRVNAGTGRRLSKKEQAHKTRNWPKNKLGSDWFKDNGNGGSSKNNLPPGYKQSDLE